MHPQKIKRHYILPAEPRHSKGSRTVNSAGKFGPPRPWAKTSTTPAPQVNLLKRLQNKYVLNHQPTKHFHIAWSWAVGLSTACGYGASTGPIVFFEFSAGQSSLLGCNLPKQSPRTKPMCLHTGLGSFKKQGMSHSQHAASLPVNNLIFFMVETWTWRNTKHYRLMFKLPLRLVSHKTDCWPLPLFPPLYSFNQQTLLWIQGMVYNPHNHRADRCQAIHSPANLPQDLGHACLPIVARHCECTHILRDASTRLPLHIVRLEDDALVLIISLCIRISNTFVIRCWSFYVM